jgi:hypothetical protein
MEESQPLRDQRLFALVNDARGQHCPVDGQQVLRSVDGLVRHVRAAPLVKYVRLKRLTYDASGW